MFTVVQQYIIQAKESSRDEVSGLHDIFSLMDRGGNGKVSAEDMKQLLNSLKCYPNDAELSRIIVKIDFDCDGEISFEDFLVYCLKQETRCSAVEEDKEIKDAFDFLDRNGDGYVSAADLRHAMRSIGRDVEEQQAEEMLAEVDEEGDGRISYECFKNIICWMVLSDEVATWQATCYPRAGGGVPMQSRVTSKTT